MKPKALISSSSVNLSIARDLSNALDPDLECHVWKDLPFSLSSYTQKDLAIFGKGFDFALLVFGFEDEALIETTDKGKIRFNVTRDNVIYELGLMSGLIGADRCFIIECHSENILNPHIPSDIVGTTNVQFDMDKSRPNMIYSCANQIRTTIGKYGYRKRISDDLVNQLSKVGLSSFYTCRYDFNMRKADDGRSLEHLKDYLSIAEKSIKVIAFTFNMGISFSHLNEVFIRKLKLHPHFTITISLLNPFEPMYYMSCYRTVTNDRSDPSVLLSEAKQNIDLLCNFMETLDKNMKDRFILKIHSTSLFESAILIDDDEFGGRIQIETKPFGTSVFDSFSFEIRKQIDNTSFYSKVKKSYDDLLANSRPLNTVMVREK